MILWHVEDSENTSGKTLSGGWSEAMGMGHSARPNAVVDLGGTQMQLNASHLTILPVASACPRW